MTIPRKKLLERIIDQFLVIKTDFWIERMTIPRKKLLERIIDQFLVIKTDIGIEGMTNQERSCWRE